MSFRVLLIAVVVALTSRAQAQYRTEDAPGRGVVAHLKVIKNKARTIKLRDPFGDATVGSPEIADIVPISDRQLYVVGKKEGTTNILLYDNEKRLIGTVDVDVRLDTANLAAKVGNAAGGRAIEVEDVDGKLVLRGNGRDAPTIERAMSTVAGLGNGPPVNAMNLRSSQQVMLNVRFVEADRTAARALGIRWQGIANNRVAGVVGTNALPGAPGTSTQLSAAGLFPGFTGAGGTTVVPGGAAGVTTQSGGSVAWPILDVINNTVTKASPVATLITQLVNTKAGSLDAVISALEEQGVVRSLAEPNLVALSGESADFLAGGEYPVPVLQGGGNGGGSGGVGSFPYITVVYKEYGVRLTFTPTVLSDGVISLKLQPEVSDLDYQNAVVLSGFVIPGLIKRRAATTVELRDGQAFAIAGLIQAKSLRDINQVPWLGSVPVLGALFRSSSFQNQETELVALVTPHLVKPVPPGNKDPRLKTPLDTSLAGNDLDFFLGGRPEVPKSPPVYVTPSGQEQHVEGHIAPEPPSASTLPLPSLGPLRGLFGGLFGDPPPVETPQ